MCGAPGLPGAAHLPVMANLTLDRLDDTARELAQDFLDGNVDGHAARSALCALLLRSRVAETVAWSTPGLFPQQRADLAESLLSIVVGRVLDEESSFDLSRVATGSLCGIRLPDGLRESDRLPAPIMTPSTKAEQGHDDLGIQRGAGHRAERRARLPVGYGVPVCPVVDQGVEDVRRAGDAGLHRNGFSAEPSRVAGPIPPLMVAMRDL